MLAEHGLVDGPDDDVLYSRLTLPSIDILPVQYYFKQANLLIITRNMDKGEDRCLFSLLESSVKLGEGIALHDLPNLAFFRSVMLTEGPCVVFEDSSNGATIGFLCLCPSWLVRSARSKCGETTLIVAKQYQVNFK